MGESAPDAVDEYRQYLARFEAQNGPVEFGSYAKRHGRLVKKLRFDEFEEKWREYDEFFKAYSQMIERGDTINDVVVKILRERQDELLLDRTI